MPKPPKTQREKDAFNRSVNLCVRPAVFRAIKVRAIEHDVTLQCEVDRALSAWLGIPCWKPEAEPSPVS